jgi:hypothetical protein
MSDARENARQALNGKLTPAKLDTLLDEVLAITKQARGWCTQCKKAVMVEVSDPKAVVSALSELLTQAEGRPGTADTDQQTIHEYRLIWQVSEVPAGVDESAVERIATPTPDDDGIVTPES